MRQYRDLMLQQGESQKKIWFTEFGYCSNPAPPPGFEYCAAIDGATQAAFLTQAFQLARDLDYVAGIMQNIHASDLHHSAETIDFNFRNRRADREIMERFPLPRFAVEVNLRRLVITGRAQTGAVEVGALNQFREAQRRLRKIDIEKLIVEEPNRFLSRCASIFFAEHLDREREDDGHRVESHPR